MVFKEKFSVTSAVIADIISHLIEDQRGSLKSFLKSIFKVNKPSSNFPSNMTEVFLGSRSNLTHLNQKQG